MDGFQAVGFWNRESKVKSDLMLGEDSLTRITCSLKDSVDRLAVVRVGRDEIENNIQNIPVGMALGRCNMPCWKI